MTYRVGTSQVPGSSVSHGGVVCNCDDMKKSLGREGEKRREEMASMGAERARIGIAAVNARAASLYLVVLSDEMRNCYHLHSAVTLLPSFFCLVLT